MTDTKSPDAQASGCCELLGFYVPAPKFKYEQKVWVYIDPRGLVDQSEVPVFEAEVVTIEFKATSGYGSRPKVAIRYELTLCDSIDEVWRNEADIYLSEADAKQAALSCVSEFATQIKDKADALAKVVAALEEA